MRRRVLLHRMYSRFLEGGGLCVIFSSSYWFRLCHQTLAVGQEQKKGNDEEGTEITRTACNIILTVEQNPLKFVLANSKFRTTTISHVLVLRAMVQNSNYLWRFYTDPKGGNNRPLMVTPEQKRPAAMMTLLDNYIQPGDISYDPLSGIYGAVLACILLRLHGRCTVGEMNDECSKIAEMYSEWLI